MLLTSSLRYSVSHLDRSCVRPTAVASLYRYKEPPTLRCSDRATVYTHLGSQSASYHRKGESLICKAAEVADVPEVEKQEEDESNEELEARAILRYCRGSPHKMRRVIDTIRGRTYEDALIILETLPYRATEPILKTLISAASNAKHNLGMRKTRLYVSECFVNEAPVFKRFRCAAKGRPAKILKRNSHITIKVKERPNAVESADT